MVPSYPLLNSYCTKIPLPAQCSGDASFLQELLGDLMAEASPHMDVLRECVPQGSMLVSMPSSWGAKRLAVFWPNLCSNITVAVATASFQVVCFLCGGARN